MDRNWTYNEAAERGPIAPLAGLAHPPGQLSRCKLPNPALFWIKGAGCSGYRSPTACHWHLSGPAARSAATGARGLTP